MTGRIYQPIRRSTKEQGLDRATWAGDTVKPYLSRVYGSGEFLTREVYFDRAFDGPPILDWDMMIVDGWTVSPHATVGINNWIIDEFGAYVGCRIWIKIACDSNCGPISECTEPIVYGDNILLDPSFEKHAASVGRDLIPFTQSGGGLFFEDTFPANADVVNGLTKTGWCSTPNGGGNTLWKVAQEEPESGNWHAETVPESPLQSAKHLRAVRYLTCFEYSTTHVPVSARLTEGDFARFTVRVKTITGSGNVRIRLHFVDGNPGMISWLLLESGAIAINSTAYTEISIESVAPDGSDYLLAEFMPHTSGAGGLRVDSAVLELQPGGG